MTPNEQSILLILIEEIISSTEKFSTCPIEEIPLGRMENFLRKQVKILSDVTPCLPREVGARLQKLRGYFEAWISSGDIPSWVEDAGDPDLDLRRFALTEWRKTHRDLKSLWVR